MLQTLFYIPERLWGMPVFGAGLLLAVCALAGVIVVGYQFVRRGWNGETAGYAALFVVLGAVIYFVLPNLCVPITRHGMPLPGAPRGLPIRGYGTMLLLAVLSSVGLAMYRAKRWGIDPDAIFELALWGIVPGIVGARAFHVIEYWSVDYAPILREQGLVPAVLAVINVPKGGLVVYGSLIGGIGGIAYYIFRRRLPLLPVLDLIAPSLVLGLAIGRIGCFLNGCCFGGACELPWAVRFPPESPAFVHQVENGLLPIQGMMLRPDPKRTDGLPVISAVVPDSPAEKAGVKPGEHPVEINGVRLADPRLDVAPIVVAIHSLGYSSTPAKTIRIVTVEGNTYRWAGHTAVPDHSRPIHPTQLYSSINAFLLFFFLLAYEPFRKRDGELFAVLMTLYPITRFVLEIIRTDEPGIVAGLSISQTVSVLILCGVTCLWFVLWRRPIGVTYPRRDDEKAVADE
ncbi:prolipoprotein diacylglyceryl transferase [Thermostilla marina]